MRVTRESSIRTINDLFGMDINFIKDVIGWKGYEFENYSDEELQEIAREQLNYHCREEPVEFYSY